jgi:hypothetical protein
VGVWCGVVWCGVVWCGVVWCGVVWCGVVWCGVVWCGCGKGAAVGTAWLDIAAAPAPTRPLGWQHAATWSRPLQHACCNAVHQRMLAAPFSWHLRLHVRCTASCSVRSVVCCSIAASAAARPAGAHQHPTLYCNKQAPQADQQLWCAAAHLAAVHQHPAAAGQCSADEVKGVIQHARDVLARGVCGRAAGGGGVRHVRSGSSDGVSGM